MRFSGLFGHHRHHFWKTQHYLVRHSIHAMAIRARTASTNISCEFRSCFALPALHVRVVCFVCVWTMCVQRTMTVEANEQNPQRAANGFGFVERTSALCAHLTYAGGTRIFRQARHVMCTNPVHSRTPSFAFAMCVRCVCVDECTSVRAWEIQTISKPKAGERRSAGFIISSSRQGRSVRRFQDYPRHDGRTDDWLVGWYTPHHTHIGLAQADMPAARAYYIGRACVFSACCRVSYFWDALAHTKRIFEIITSRAVRARQ